MGSSGAVSYMAQIIQFPRKRVRQVNAPNRLQRLLNESLAGRQCGELDVRRKVYQLRPQRAGNDRGGNPRDAAGGGGALLYTASSSGLVGS